MAARTPNLDRLFATCPYTTIGASGMDVGLPDGQMGNSEVGHTNIGAGRIVYQELTLSLIHISPISAGSPSPAAAASRGGSCWVTWRARAGPCA